MLHLQHAAALLCCAAAFAQTPPTPAFEAASVKPSPAGSRIWPTLRGGPGTSDPGRIVYTNVTLSRVLERAYDVRTYQVSGPDRLTSDRYDISATIPAGAGKQQFERMLQSLLAQRFHLALHRETRQLAGYELLRGRNAPKLKPSSEGDAAPAGAPPESPPQTGADGFPQLTAPGLAMMEGVRGKSVVSFLTARAQPLSALVEMLSKEFRLPILDRTGLGGNFDFTLAFAPQPPGTPPRAPSPDDPPAAPDDSAPNLIVAVRQQLGLRLIPSKIPVEVLVIDKADRVPAEN